MKLITSSTPVCVATYENGAFLCNISLGVGSGARLEHVCITHHLTYYWYYTIIYTTCSFHATIFSKITCCPFTAAPCTRQCIYDASNRNHGFPNSWPMGGLLGTLPACVTSEVQKTGPWAHFWGFFSVNPPRGGFSSGHFYGDCRYFVPFLWRVCILRSSTIRVVTLYDMHVHVLLNTYFMETVSSDVSKFTLVNWF